VTASLVRNPELESAIREDPWDDARWSALEVYLLSQRDPRSELIRFVRDGSAGDLALEVGRLERLLFGNVPRSFYKALRREWSAGFLRGCDLSVERGGRDASSLVRALGCAPVAALLRELSVQPTGDYVEASMLLEELHAAAFTPWLRSLRVVGNSRPLPVEALAPFTRLEHLDLGEDIVLGRLPQPLTRLRCGVIMWDEARAFFAPGAHPNLTSLRLVATFGFGQGRVLEGLEALFDGTSAPRLQEIVFEKANAAGIALVNSVPSVIQRSFA
jgi:hypothetical protein